MRAVPRIFAVIPAVLLTAAACEAPADSADADTGANWTGTADTGFTSSPTNGDTATLPTPAWWSLEGSFVVSGGEIDLASSSLEVTLSTSDVSTICTTVRQLASAETLAPADASLYALWSVSLAEGEGCPASVDVPDQFELGIGEYDPQLDPALDGSGIEPAALFGLYLRQPASLFVFGVAGTAEQLAGQPAEAPPLPDGTYSLDGLHVLPL